MKKLLSILTISTLTASVPVPLMAMKSSDDKWEIITNDIYTNLLVVDTNINLGAYVGWNGSDTENKVIDLGETKNMI